MESTTTQALKEWAVAVDALEQGKTIVLLRKGGIREEGNRFQVAYDQVLLYPTYEHQQPDLLKAEYTHQVTPVTSGWHPETVRVGSWAEITDILRVSEPPDLEALSPYHIWNEKFVSARFKWKPRQPLYILLLRTYKLTSVHQIPYRSEYGGCRSWIDLAAPISLEGSVPVLGDGEYVKETGQICQVLKELRLQRIPRLRM
ncbi:MULTISPECIES: DUF1802 family protein [unclassified Coleofasciculus]|uniref:DUF1802 family protein n=1 Tax=unclassified Coleofasciculus TaxID=2692782 RepID=UPI001882D0F1|nr:MULTISPECIES: DUF1802 family protein [unclassified Coleofasciculus]MBE9124903.1 DUF1802 family protein [Coleofasciculus sp. LEGE 07081]MBE9147852.1 DUF1802 family protein [Coleofasciculus sp. LEGE 07092]